jgi:hypothetical protein
MLYGLYRDGVKVQEQTGANWENKKQRGIEIEKAGDAAEGGGKMSARKVTGMNNAAVLSALEEGYLHNNLKS